MSAAQTEAEVKEAHPIDTVEFTNDMLMEFLPYIQGFCCVVEGAIPQIKALYIPYKDEATKIKTSYADRLKPLNAKVEALVVAVGEASLDGHEDYQVLKEEYVTIVQEAEAKLDELGLAFMARVVPNSIITHYIQHLRGLGIGQPRPDLMGLLRKFVGRR